MPHSIANFQAFQLFELHPILRKIIEATATESKVEYLYFVTTAQKALTF